MTYQPIMPEIRYLNWLPDYDMSRITEEAQKEWLRTLDIRSTRRRIRRALAALGYKAKAGIKSIPDDKGGCLVVIVIGADMADRKRIRFSIVMLRALEAAEDVLFLIKGFGP